MSSASSPDGTPPLFSYSGALRYGTPGENPFAFTSDHPGWPAPDRLPATRPGRWRNVIVILAQRIHRPDQERQLKELDMNVADDPEQGPPEVVFFHGDYPLRADVEYLANLTRRPVSYVDVNRYFLTFPPTIDPYHQDPIYYKSTKWGYQVRDRGCRIPWLCVCGFRYHALVARRARLLRLSFVLPMASLLGCLQRMIEFWFRDVFHHPFLSDVKYIMRLDTDSSIITPWPNLFAEMRQKAAVYYANFEDTEWAWALPGEGQSDSFLYRLHHQSKFCSGRA
jgi:hypothetical protein